MVVVEGCDAGRGPYLLSKNRKTWERSEVSNARLLKPCSHSRAAAVDSRGRAHSPSGEARGALPSDFPIAVGAAVEYYERSSKSKAP
jgi:hypothetical protein